MAAALSPSRASDFMQCPLLYRFRVIDKLPQAPSAAAARGTLVHAVLERVFDLPAAGRTLDAAAAMVGPQWAALLEAEPELAELVDSDDPEALGLWVKDAVALVERWFTLEDPTRLEPAERELYVETDLDGLTLRGYVDRLDIAPTGEIRVVDYKTGRSPSELFEGKALFQMKFYALVLWRLHGTIPRMLQLVYLGNSEIVRYTPDEADLRATERKLKALWRAIEHAAITGDWRPRTSRLCDWCDHRALCPAWGGTPPELPEGAELLALNPRSSAAVDPAED
jgi:putative RecB family exonuclease